MEKKNTMSKKTKSSTGITPQERDENFASGNGTDSPSAAKDNLANIWESPDFVDCLSAYVSTMNTSDEAEPDDSLVLAPFAELEVGSVSESEKKIRKTTGLTLAEWYELISEELSTEDLKNTLIPYFKMIDESATNLPGRDFMDLAKTVQSLGKNQLALKTAYVIKECVKEYYGNEYDDDDFHETIDALQRFSTNLKDCRGNSKLFFPKAPEIMALLKEKNLLTDEIRFVYQKLKTEKSDVQKRMDEFKYIDLSGIVEYIKSLEQTGLLSEVLLTRFKMFAKESEISSMAMELQLNRMKEFAKYLKDIQNPENRLTIQATIEVDVDVLRKLEKKVSKVNEREKLLKKAETESKMRICRSEHNTPFCSNCGVRTSWLKAFKKRGVHVKEAVNGTKEHIWQNNIKRG